jgi:hypothetical protein
LNGLRAAFKTLYSRKCQHIFEELNMFKRLICNVNLGRIFVGAMGWEQKGSPFWDYLWGI